ncbi:thymidine kinase [Borrelia venezuelensis]|uniref:thymidine kinase n=1 Tax=Borrelia venezuelensis TaxID=1653839 RepID=UPI001FF65FC8|nr:thymidine kinase [Borrelia venezuelensis]UPA12433.1 thymidine kinase [Borrelia venezuelensis]
MSFYFNLVSGDTKSKLDDIVSISHFDFKANLNLMLIIGPMGSGKTEYAAKIYKDSLIIKNKSSKVLDPITKGRRNRANIFFIRNILDKKRFKDYPKNVIPYRGGGSDRIDGVDFAGDSFDVGQLIDDNPEYGTFIIDETCFYDERLVFILNKIALDSNVLFILPTLLYNFRKEIFNNTAKLLIEYSDKICRLGAYCEHVNCMDESFLTYRYYFYKGEEIAAPYFDPLLIVGGDEIVESAIYPNYATRCSRHHYLVGREYFFTILKPFALLYTQGDKKLFEREIMDLSSNVRNSNFENSLLIESRGKYDIAVLENLLGLPFLAERALITLSLECNILSKGALEELIDKFSLSKDYIQKVIVSKEYQWIF